MLGERMLGERMLVVSEAYYALLVIEMQGV